MKFLRFLCNLLLFFVVMVGISFTQIGIYDISAAQSKDVEGIHISAPSDDKIAYFDSYAFWITDISTNFKQEPKYRVRNWIAADWWKKGMKWADTGLDFVIATIKPILVPIAQVNAVKTYYGKSIDDFTDYLIKAYDSEEAAKNAVYELYFFGQGYGEQPEFIKDWEYTGNMDLTMEYTDCDYARWVRNNGKLYNTVWRLNKYNCGSYDKYFKKFIKEESGVRYIKTGTVVLYYQQYVSMILAVIFIIKYPVGMIQGRYVGKKGDKQL